MREESSPFLDEAFGGVVAGLVGSIVGIAIYTLRHAGYPGLGDAGPGLAAEVASFNVVLSALICGFVGFLRTRIGRFKAIAFVVTAAGPVAYAFASVRFSHYRIPFVDHFIGALLVTFLFMVKRFAPSAPWWRAAVALLVSALPFAFLGAFLPLLHASVETLTISRSFTTGGLGAIVGAVVGPLCALWLCLAVWKSEAPAAPIEPSH
ncbi:MAG: hypothetical protein AB8H86_33945 [Polyangiales bacterium]